MGEMGKKENVALASCRRIANAFRICQLSKLRKTCVSCNSRLYASAITMVVTTQNTLVLHVMNFAIPNCQARYYGQHWRRCEMHIKHICGRMSYLIASGVALLIATAAFADVTYEILDNTPFATRARGIVGAISVDARGVRTKRHLQWRVQWAVRSAEWRLRKRRPRVIRFLQRYGFWRYGRRLGIGAIVAAVRSTDKQLIRADSLPRWGIMRKRQPTREYGAGQIEFEFQGFTQEMEAALRNWLNGAMPHLIDVYGAPVTSPPNSTRKVTIILDTTLDALDGGVYSPSTDEIRIPAFEQRHFDYFNLIHQIFHAFRGPLLLAYPAWEEGMARAAAILATRRIIPGFDPASPTDGDPLFLMPLYDLLNQPPLANNLFLPPSGFIDMAIWRIGMSAAAWLKVAVENPNFFKQFNEQYYAQYDPKADAPLSGNVPALKEIARRIVPQVEGLNFLDWYRRQYVLDTSVRTGFKLYIFHVPLQIGILIVINYYRTTPTGDEVALNGHAHLIYSNDLNDDLYAEEGNDTDVINGEGFIAPQFFNIGGANRITIDVTVEKLKTTIYFPYDVRGPENEENPLFGAVIGADEAELTIRTTDNVEAQATVSRGVFAITEGIDLNELRKFTIEHKYAELEPIVEYRNAGFGFYILLLRARTSIGTVNHTFARGWHLMGVPIIPLKSDEAEILGIPPEKLLLAHWQPNLPGNQKYEIYPRISMPMLPGVGYWLRVDEDIQVTIQGMPTPTDEPYEIPLLAGFNQLANPFPFTVRVADFQVKYGDEGPVDLQTAQQNGWIDPTIWIWTQEQGYQMATFIPPWSGFWVRALRPDGIWLLIPPISPGGG